VIFWRFNYLRGSSACWRPLRLVLEASSGDFERPGTGTLASPPQSGRHATMSSGNCVCGQVRYESTEVPSGVTACHCLECRKAFAAPYGPWFAVLNASLTWSTRPDVIEKTEIAERGYCSQCKTAVTMQYYLQPARISISAHTIAIPLPVEEHLFLKEKEEGYILPEDGASKYEAFDPPFERKLQEWKRTHRSQAVGQ
jgi:hypothetical protein